MLAKCKQLHLNRHQYDRHELKLIIVNYIKHHGVMKLQPTLQLNTFSDPLLCRFGSSATPFPPRNDRTNEERLRVDFFDECKVD